MKKLKKMKDFKASKVPNKMHLEVCVNTRMNIVESKKRYKRSRDKKVISRDYD